MRKVIFHSDINSCYANIEVMYDRSLSGKPVAVGGEPEERHGIILAKTPEAKACGVKTGEAIWQAMRKCPELVVIPPHYDRYFLVSKMTREIYSEYTDRIEPFGLDEAWLDVTSSAHGDGELLADELRRRIRSEVGVTVSVGVGDNKIFAKLGSDMKKPDAVTVITPENYRQKVWPLPVGDLLYVGRATETKLKRRGVDTIGQLAATPTPVLRSWLGKMGEVLGDFARGGDASPVARAGDSPLVKSIGNSTTTPRDIESDADAHVVFHLLADSVAQRLREGGFLAGTVVISVRNNALGGFERQMKTELPTNLSSEIWRTSMTLFRGSWSWPRAIRSLGVRAVELMPDTTPAQTSVFLPDEKRQCQEKLEREVDALRARFGQRIIDRGVVLSDPSLVSVRPKSDHLVHPVGYFNG